MRFIDVGLDGFDTHDDQNAVAPRSVGASWTAAIQAFYSTVSPAYLDRITIMTMSEFGRTSFSNESGGTDHGTANDMFVIGSRVKGGLYGMQPSLAGLGAVGPVGLHTSTSGRCIGTVLDGWMGGGGSTILNGNFENLGFFNGGPGAAGGGSGPVIVLPPAAAERVRADGTATRVRHPRRHRRAQLGAVAG